AGLKASTTRATTSSKVPAASPEEQEADGGEATCRSLFSRAWNRKLLSRCQSQGDSCSSICRQKADGLRVVAPGQLPSINTMGSSKETSPGGRLWVFLDQRLRRWEGRRGDSIRGRLCRKVCGDWVCLRALRMRGRPLTGISARSGRGSRDTETGGSSWALEFRDLSRPTRIVIPFLGIPFTM
ncbi:hypothetical protein BHE74_00052482, partial [Ensete ventricosum]